MSAIASRILSLPASTTTGRRRVLGFTLPQHAGALALFALVTFVFFLPVVHGQTFLDVAARQEQIYPWAGVAPQDNGSPLHFDQDESFYPWQVFMSRSLRHGQFPLWNPYSFAGAPFFANGQSGVLYPPRLALAYTVSPTRVHDVLLATHMFAAGVAMFLLLGMLGVSFAGALVGGIAWMLNSFGLAWQALEHYTAIEVWLPVGLLLAHAAVRRRSWPAAFGLALALGLMFVGGNVLFVELAIVTVFAYAAVHAGIDARADRRLLPGNLARLVVAGALFAGLAAVSYLPTLALAATSVRVSLSYDQLGQFALTRHTLYELLRPYSGVLAEPYHHDLFAGTAVALLAVVGLVRREAAARFAAALGVLTILFMLHTPVTWVVDHALPGFGNFKPLARAAFLLQLALAVLAAYGTDTVLRWLRLPLGRRVASSPLLLGLLLGIVVDRLVHRAVGVRLPYGSSVVLTAGAVVVAVAAFEWARHSPRLSLGRLEVRRGQVVSAVGVGLVLAVLGSIVVQERAFARLVMPHQRDVAELRYPATPLIRWLRRRPGARMLPTYPAFRGSTAMLYPIESAGGYESLLPGRTEDFWRVVGEGHGPASLASDPLIYAYHPAFQLPSLRPALLARAGVDYVVAPPPGPAVGRAPAGLTLRYSGRDGRVYAVDDALPRAYVVGACTSAPTPLAALERFVKPGFRAGSTVVLERRACAGRAGRAGSATIVRTSLNGLDLRVRAERPGWLVVSSSWDRGWQATVDGHVEAVLPADYAFRAVRVPAGVHVVRFSYRPASLRIGIIVSAVALALTLLGLATALVAARRARTRPG